MAYFQGQTVSFREGTSLFYGSLYGHTDEIINEQDPGGLGYIRGLYYCTQLGGDYNKP